MTPLQKAEAEVTRLTGIETQFNTLQGQVPGGNLTALLTEHTRRGTELERLTGIEGQHNTLLAQIPNGDLPAFVAEQTRLSGEVTRLTAELEGFDERVNLRAAEMVAGTGNQPPAPPDNPALTSGAEPANFADFRDEHARLSGQDSVKAATYYKTWSKKFGF